jgi:hypothetical protein
MMTSSSSQAARQQGLIPADETVRWSGAPRGGLLLRRSDAWTIPFSLFWGGIVIFGWSPAVRSGNPLTELLGIALVALGVYQIAGRFVWDAYVRARTRYTVTDRAAYVVTAGIGGGVQRLAGSELIDVRLERNADGSGTMRFGPEPPAYYNGRSWTRPPRYGFEAIRELDAAYSAVLDAQRG